jgi:integrase
MNVTRSIAYGIVGRCKTEASQKPVPVHPILAAALIHWRDRCRYREPEDWVFANEHHRGRHPYWGQVILRRLIRPVVERIGIKKRIGWHKFRHTYSMLLRSVGTEFKVMQELLRHSSLRSTIDIYTQAVTPAKHAAQAAVLSLVFPTEPEAKDQFAERENASPRGRHRSKGFEGAKRTPNRVLFALANARRNLA